MSEQTFQPRSEFVRTEATPQSYALVALNGADTLRCHNISRSALSALRDAFGNETRLYGEANNGEIAEFVFRNSPWSAKSVRSETLIVQLFTTLLAHQYTFVTSIDYGRQYLDKLSLTFTRAASSHGRPTPDAVFALSFVTPTVLRVLHAPLHCTPAILQSVRSAWPRGVKDERKLGTGCWEFRLKGFGYFSAEKSDEALIPHVFALLRSFDSHAFKLVAGVPIGGRSRNKDLWVFTAPGTSKPPSQQSPSPYQPTLESETAYSPGPFTASPTVGTGGHAKFATEEPERAPPVVSHARSASVPAASATPPHRKPAPPMAMPVPAITRPTPPVANPPMTMPVPSPAKPSPQSKPAPLSKPAPVPVPIPPKRNSSLLRKFRASGSGRSSGRFKHPPAPPSASGSGHARSGSLASGEIIYETPLPGQQPLPPASAPPNGYAPAPTNGPPPPPSAFVPPTNGFIAPPPPPPIPSQSQPQAQVGNLPSANRTEELLPRGAFRDSAFSASTEASHDVDVLWTGAAMAKGGPGEPLSLVREESLRSREEQLSRARDGELSFVHEGSEVEAHSPDVTRTMHEELRPKSEKAELALAGPPPPRPIPVPGSGLPLPGGSPAGRKMSIDGRKTSIDGRKPSTEGGRKKSIDGRKTSIDGRKTSVDGRKPSTEGRKTPTGRPSMSKSGTQTEWVFVSVDKPPPVPGTESSSSSPMPQVQAIKPEAQPVKPETAIVDPEPEPEHQGGFKRWFGGKSKPKAKAKPRRRGGLNQAIRSSKRLTID